MLFSMAIMSAIAVAANAGKGVVNITGKRVPGMVSFHEMIQVS